MLEKYIELLKPEVEKMFSTDSSGHDMSHLERTMKNALYIQSKEGGDQLVIGVAAFLHDIHRLKENESGKYCSPKDSLPIVEKLLNKVSFPKELILKVLNAIEHHEMYNWHDNENKKRDIETLIVQDADNLDGIGTMGIARTFCYAGSHKLKLYDPKIPLNESDDYQEENGGQESSIYHFYHKLFKLGDYMNTATAKNLSKERIEYMKEFTERFIKEWSGEI